MNSTCVIDGVEWLNSFESNGGFVIEIIVLFYFVLILDVLCDEFFVESIEKIAFKLGMSREIAGVLLLPWGASLVEICVSMMSGFQKGDDVGVSYIYGSCIYNLLFITGIVSINSTKAITLNSFSIIRDSFFLVGFAFALFYLLKNSGGRPRYIEGVVLIAGYLFYVSIVVVGLMYQKYYNNNNELGGEKSKDRKNSIGGGNNIGGGNSNNVTSGGRRRSSSSANSKDGKTELDAYYEFSSDDEEEILKSENGNSLCFHSTMKCFKKPAKRFFKLILPSPKTYPSLSVLFSAIIIGALAYSLVFFVHRFACLLHIDDSIFGITALAIVGEAPDVLMAIAIAKRGFGSMAIGLSFGDNMLSLSVGNGLAWLVAAIFQQPFLIDENNPVLQSGFYLFLTSVGAFCACLFLLPKCGNLSLVKGWLLLGAYTFFLAYYCITKGTGEFPSVSP